MSDGTVPVKRAIDVTSAIPDDMLRDIRDVNQITMEFGQYFIWTAWVVVGGKAFKYSSHLDRNEAYRVAKSFCGVVTETPLSADFREQANGGQESNH